MKLSSLTNQIVTGNCLSVMAALPDGSIDCIISDPPYGMSYRPRPGAVPMLGDRDRSWLPLFIAEAYRLLKPNSHLYLFANDHALCTIRALAAGAGMSVKRTLVWEKSSHTRGDLMGDYASRTEFVFFAHKGRRTLRGRRVDNVLAFPRPRFGRHPAEKPEELVRLLIERSTAPGELVLDPFAGSGTTCAAAAALGRAYIGIELDERYAEIGRERLKAGRALETET